MPLVKLILYLFLVHISFSYACSPSRNLYNYFCIYVFQISAEQIAYKRMWNIYCSMFKLWHLITGIEKFFYFRIEKIFENNSYFWNFVFVV